MDSSASSGVLPSSPHGGNRSAIDSYRGAGCRPGGCQPRCCTERSGSTLNILQNCSVSVTQCKGLIHRDKLAEDEVCAIDGMPATTPARTAFDLGRRGRLETAIARLDALACATKLERRHVDPLIERHRGARGIVQPRQAVDLIDAGAESPQETRTRLLLINAGFPRPKTQIVICNDYGDFVAHMGWPEWRVGLQYYGLQHWSDPDRHARDIDQQAELQELEWRIIRVSRNLLWHRSPVFLIRVREAMRARAGPIATRSDLMHAYRSRGVSLISSPREAYSAAGSPNLSNRVVSRNATTCVTPAPLMSSTCS